MSQIEITCGVVSSSWTDSCRGRSYNFSNVGKRMFFVELVEPEGRAALWDGESYEAAIISAHELAKDYGEGADLQVVDLVVTGGLA